MNIYLDICFSLALIWALAMSIKTLTDAVFYLKGDSSLSFWNYLTSLLLGYTPLVVVLLTYRHT